MIRTLTTLLALLPALCLAQYPVACYPFTGGSGADVSGNGFNGTVVGAAAVPDRIGAANNALDFNGTTDHVNIGVFGNIIPADEFSVSFWLKADGSNSDAAILMVPDLPSDRLCIAPHYNHSSGNTVFWDYGDIFNDGRCAIIPYTLSTTWDHWVFVHSVSQDRMSIYVNGVLAHEELHHSTIVDRTKSVRIGGGPASGGADFFFHGLIDDVQFYDVALSSSFVSSLYTAQVNGGFTCSQVGISEANFSAPVRISWNGSSVLVDWADAACIGDLILIDAQGRIVEHRTTLSGSRWQLPVTGLAPGLYTVRCIVNGRVSFGTVMVE
jgi:hypothetical protein